MSWGPALTDLAYFLGCALPTEDRREHYDALLRAYHEALGPQPPITLADVADGVRRQSFFGVMMAIVSSMLVERTDRGDQMFMTMLRRHCDHVLDTDALATLPAASAPEPLQPSPEDELAHDPTTEPLWSESWYADFADPAQGLGGWFRLGLVANQQTAWVHALVCGPDMPTVAVDAQVPLPPDPWTVRTDTFEITHSAGAPLRSYRVDVRALARPTPTRRRCCAGARHPRRDDHEPGLAHRRHALQIRDDDPLRDSVHRHRQRHHRRHRLPHRIRCRTTRSLLGVRDWWSMDWIWSALHLDDGTHLHGVNIRIPGAPAFSIGYTRAPTAKSPNCRPSTRENPSATTDYRWTRRWNSTRARSPRRWTCAARRRSGWSPPTAGQPVPPCLGRRQHRRRPRGVGWLEWNRNLGERIG
ncbi:ecdysteroid kinase family protein [Mycobacterium avium subsp. avium 2285 (R)]|nr:ecdysteroid kinase family protein [Mycobacterium avium subsp. avium 2285 (R)]